MQTSRRSVLRRFFGIGSINSSQRPQRLVTWGVSGVVLACGLVGCSGSGPVADAVNPEPVKLAAVAEPIVSTNNLDLTFLGPDSVIAVVAFPSRLSQRPWATDPVLREPLDRFFTAGGEQTIDWTKCERLAVAVAIEPSSSASPTPPVTVRSEWLEPTTIDQVLGPTEGFADQTIDGRNYKVNVEAGVGFWQENDKTIWFSSWERLKTLHERKAPTSRLARALAARPLTTDAEVIIDLASVRQFSEGMNPNSEGEGEGDDALMQAAMEKAKTMVIEVDSSQDRMLLATVALGDAQLATDLQKMGRQRMQQAFVMVSTLAAFQFSRLPEETGAAATELLQTVWQGIKLEAEGEEIKLSLTVADTVRPKLALLIDYAVVEQRKAQRRAAFQQVAEAIKKYVAEKGDVPRDTLAADGTPLLSWRVALLPYLDEQALYDEFKLDEAWDSATNQPLIERMPAVFQANETGKTSIVAFSGEGMVGQPTRTTPASDAIETTLAFAGVNNDRAETWTAPGGLKEFSSDVLKSVGEADSDQLPIVTADGVAHLLSRWERQKNIAAMLTADGGEELDKQDIFPEPSASPGIPGFLGGLPGQ